MKKTNLFSISALALSAFMLNTASAQENPASGGCYASSVSFFNQGKTALGTDVNPERSFPERALGAPNAQTPAVNAAYQDFVSLGFGGVLEVAFAAPIANGPGADIRIWESSATASSERSLIEVSQDGLGYLPVGQITADGEVDFGDAFSDFIQFVRITDVTPNNGGGQVTDGYDVDAVECLHGEYVAPGCYPNMVVSFNQGPAQDQLTPVAAERSNPNKALFMPENDYTQNFFTLGFGGEITLKFESPIKNGEGDDVRVIESTFGASVDGNCARYPETIRAYASQDGCNFIYLGEGCQDTDFDLGILGWAQYIKLVDISPLDATYFGTSPSVSDGYDLDGVMCLNGYEENPVPADLTAGSATSWVSFNQGKRKDGNDVAGSRSNPDNALGMPQGGDVINFVSLGFGGDIVLKFDYVIFDNPTDNDLLIVETTYNNEVCGTYPEKVMVEGSLDGENWVVLTEELCLDGEVDINAAGAIQYIRIKDRSMASQFSNSADGYDVDGVVVINSCNDENAEEDARKGDNINTPDEITSASVSPNPFKSEIRLELTTGTNDRTAQIRVFNVMGQNVYTSTVNIGSSSNVFETISLNELKSGVYFVNVETESSKETIRVIKQ